MPLQGAYEWSQKKDQLLLLVPLKGVAPSKVDIIATSSTLKINFSPYLIDIVLNGQIDSLRHKARVKDGTLHLTLFKAQLGIWENLEISNDENQKAKIRSEANEKQKELDDQIYERRKDRKIADERFSTRKQMALEEAERNRLENKKEEEKKTAEEEVYASFAKMQAKAVEEEKIMARGPAGSKPAPSKAPEAMSAAAESKKIGHGLGATYDLKENEIDSDIEDAGILDVIEEEESAEEIYSSNFVHENQFTNHLRGTQAISDSDADIKYVPPPRMAAGTGTASVGINFTPRVFPTPMRESKQAEEQDWIAKNRKHLKKHGQLGKNLTKGNGVDISEEDPSWLKAKGDDFFRGGDYRSAINAYSSAIEADETMVACYSNRSACFLKLGVPSDCRSDCTEAIELISKLLTSDQVDEEETSQLKKSMAKLLMRRGISNCQLGNYADASTDYASGIEIMVASGSEESNITTARSDLEKLLALQTADTNKKKGDEVMAEGNIAEAIDLYTRALHASPVHVGCLSNRAAGKLAIHDYEGCISDCSAALHILDEDERSSSTGKIMSGAGADSLSMMTAVLPPKGSDKRKSWVLKTLVRRGAAYAQNKDIDAAIVDYGKACALDPTNTALKEDLNKMTNYRAGLRAEASKLQ